MLALLLLALSRSPDDPQAMAPVKLSAQSGFYDEAFYLEMVSARGQLRYTLDSNDPDENSLLYTGPILIRDVSGDENTYALRTDVCLELNGDILESAGVKPKYGFTTPTEPVDKATVVRAVCIDAFGNRSDVVTAVYFVGYDQRTAYDGLNVVSVVTDPDNLFDYDRGIYVLGRTFGETLVDGKVVPPVSSNLGVWPANYKNKGIEWEREAAVCFFDADRTPVLSGNCGIRIQGGASRAMLPKSLNLFARRRYGQTAFPTAQLFGEDWQLHTLNLNSGGQGVRTKIHDVLVNTMVSDMKVLTREYEPCAMFLDGEFWGVYWLTPRFKEDYLESKYGIPADEVIETKVDYIEVGYGEDFNSYKAMMGFIGDGDMSDPDTYARLCELVDIDSWVDYYAIEIYVANTDWPKNNRSMWRTRDVIDHPWGDGRWRWIMFDVNLAMELDRADENFVSRTVQRDAIFASLMESREFKKALYARLVTLAEVNFHPDRVDAFVDEYEQAMRGVMALEYKRFLSDRTEQDFIQSCEDIKAFYRARHDYILEAYGEKQG